MSSSRPKPADAAVASEKQREVQYVRAEKAADDRAEAKLIEVYGGGAKRHDGGVRRRIWTCNECNYKNTDTRDCCGMCLAANPAVLSPHRRGKNALVAPRATADPSAKLVHISGRVYREFHHPAAKPRVQFRAPPSDQQQQQFDADDDEGPCKPCRPAAAAAAARDDDDEYNDEYDEGGFGGGGGGGATGGGDYIDEDEDEDGITFDTTAQSYCLTFPCPSRYFKFICGRGHSTINEISRMTGATLKMVESSSTGDALKGGAATAASKQMGLSKRDSENDHILIQGPNRTCVSAARIRIESIMMSSEAKVEFTHFLSVPLCTEQGSRGTMSSFLQEAARLCIDEEKHIDPFCFQVPARLHLTLLMLRLHSETELQRARELMAPQGPVASLVKKIFPHKYSLSFTKLDVMNDDPSSAHVVFLAPDRERAKPLVQFVSAVNEMFQNAGLAQAQDAMICGSERLHATVLNSKWRAGSVTDGTAAMYSSGGSAGRAPRVAFDASELLRLYSDVSSLGSHPLQRLDLSLLGAGNAADGYFAREASVYFP